VNLPLILHRYLQLSRVINPHLTLPWNLHVSPQGYRLHDLVDNLHDNRQDNLQDNLHDNRQDNQQDNRLRDPHVSLRLSPL
jgi:hypothetical protein